MTEAEWLACKNPRHLLHFLDGRASSRKFWLFAVAGAGFATQVLPEDMRQEIARVGVSLADETASDDERLRTWNFAQDRMEMFNVENDLYHVWVLSDWQDILAGRRADTRGGTAPDVSRILRNGLAAAQERGFRAARWVIDLESNLSNPPNPLNEAYRTSMCATLHEVFGNPHRPVSCQPDWLRWNDRLIAELAAAVYRERTFDRLPILADALEDAGCADRAILDHLRGPGPHVRGCWVVDLILGKQ
jgi:hypothetical protein